VIKKYVPEGNNTSSSFGKSLNSDKKHAALA